MSIVSARSRIIERAPSAQLNTSYGDAPDFRARVIVQLTDESGVVGFGEASPLPFFTGETVAGIDLQLRETYLPLLAGRSAFDLHAIHQSLEVLPENSSAKAAIDVALYDLQAKLIGRPMVDLLGGKVRDHIDCTYPIGIAPVAEAVREAEGAVERGISTLKLKIGRDPRADIERVRAIRSAVGPDIRIRIDANAGYTAPQAIQIIDRLSDVDLEYVEQPVARWDIRGLAAVRRATGVRVMADESLHTVRDAVELIEREAVDVFAIKLIKTGGLTQARAIAQIAAAYSVDIVVVSPFETQIGAAAGLALALSAPTGWRAHELRVFDSQAGMATTGIRFERGSVFPCDWPGLGVESIPELAAVPAL